MNPNKYSSGSQASQSSNPHVLPMWPEYASTAANTAAVVMLVTRDVSSENPLLLLLLLLLLPWVAPLLLWRCGHKAHVACLSGCVIAGWLQLVQLRDEPQLTAEVCLTLLPLCPLLLLLLKLQALLQRLQAVLFVRRQAYMALSTDC